MTRVPVALLSYGEARAEACGTCESKACCHYLVLQTIPLQTLLDLDRALYLLNFGGVYLQLPETMESAEVYLYQPCSKLDSEGLCSVHGTGDQPGICVAYQSQGCSYRRAFVPDDYDGAPIVDRTRMTWLVQQMAFDDDRRIVARPPWEIVMQAFRAMPTTRTFAASPETGNKIDWQKILLTAKSDTDILPRRFDDPGVLRPCDGCAAWCCQTLVIDRARPTTAWQVDYYRYAMGFPSVEVRVSEAHWSIVVHTTCRHLESGRCSVFGSPERPILCETYDEFDCDARADFGQDLPTESLRISLRQFPVLADSLIYDDFGRVIAIPPLDVMRNRVLHAEAAAADHRSVDLIKS